MPKKAATATLTVDEGLGEMLAKLRRQQAEQMQKYERELAEQMAEQTARIGKKIRAALSERIKASKDETLKSLWRDYNATLKATDDSKPTATIKRSGGATATNNKAAFEGDVSAVVRFIKENEGCGTRSLTSNFGKADWESVLSGKATSKGEGSGKKWFPN